MQKEGYKICTVACRSAQTKPTGVIADDTDNFQLLIHHADLSDYYENMYMITLSQTVHLHNEKNLDPEGIYGLLSLYALTQTQTQAFYLSYMVNK